MHEGVYVHLLDMHWVCTEKNWHWLHMNQVGRLASAPYASGSHIGGNFDRKLTALRSDSRAPVWTTETAESAEGRRIELSIMYSSYWTFLGGVTR
jgi:hypothetical protein